jgi:hypothetical protein
MFVAAISKAEGISVDDSALLLHLGRRICRTPEAPTLQ